MGVILEVNHGQDLGAIETAIREQIWFFTLLLAMQR